MQKDTITSLTDNFEAHAQQTENGIEYWLARDLQHLLGYTEWRNFEGVIKRAIGIIRHKNLNGTIEKTSATVKIGSGATRKIVDYKLNQEAFELLKELCSGYKMTNSFTIRNESVVLQLVEKYCKANKIIFYYQFLLNNYRFDCMLGDKILLEFDEPHHYQNTRQARIDLEKEKVAKRNGFLIFRVTLDMDIVDIIVFIERNLS
jgi:very-short-patch-repair endonuclease